MRYRRLPHTLTWHYDFKAPVEKVWPWVSNTDRLNRAARLPEVNYIHEPVDSGSSRRFGSYKVSGFDLRWREYPYEWAENEYFKVERTYSMGPLRKMDMLWELKPYGSGTRLTQTMSFEAKSWFFTFITKLQTWNQVRRGFLKAYQNIDQFITASKPLPFLSRKDDLESPSRESLKLFQLKLKNAGIAQNEIELLREFIFKSPKLDLIRIRPFAMADAWKRDRHQTLVLFLKATEAGVFSLSWDLLCPSCRGAKERTESLADMKGSAHCDACNIQYDAHFDESVEISFTVNESIRVVKSGEFCVGGPRNTPHFLRQVRIRSGEVEMFTHYFDAGTYRIRSLQSPKVIQIEVVEGERVKKDVIHSFSFSKLVPADSLEEKITLGVGAAHFRVGNAMTDQEIICMVEDTKWRHDICTAAYVTSIHEFRSRFSSEILAPGQSIGVSSMTLMFTDIKGSTAIYNDMGDAAAYTLVRDHFKILEKCITENFGSVVKTIGDSVMAVFTQPENAVKAALEIHKQIQESHLKIKVGIHCGPCFVVTLNEKLDYFGSHVNIAARTEGQCEGGDIVLTKAMIDLKSVRSLFTRGVQVEKINRSLKGFDKNFELFRVVPKGLTRKAS